MSCLVDNFISRADGLIFPNIGSFLECNLYDLEPGSGQFMLSAPAAELPAESGSPEEGYSFAGGSVSTQFSWPAVGKKDHVKMEFLTGRPLETIDVFSFINSIQGDNVVKGAMKATLWIYEDGPTEPPKLRTLTADARIQSSSVARWQLVRKWGELRFTLDTSSFSVFATSVSGTWDPPITPQPHLAFEGGQAFASDIVLKFRKGWTAYNPGIIQTAL